MTKPEFEDFEEPALVKFVFEERQGFIEYSPASPNSALSRLTVWDNSVQEEWQIVVSIDPYKETEGAQMVLLQELADDEIYENITTRKKAAAFFIDCGLAGFECDNYSSRSTMTLKKLDGEPVLQKDVADVLAKLSNHGLITDHDLVEAYLSLKITARNVAARIGEHEGVCR